MGDGSLDPSEGRILSIDNLCKSAVVYNESRKEICVYEWIPWTQERVSKLQSLPLIPTDQNDIFHRFNALDGMLMVTKIFPATDLLVKKYSDDKRVMLRETPEMYQSKTIKYLKDARSACLWIQKVFDGAEPTLWSNADFCLVKDSKWTQTNDQNSFYLLALYRRPTMSDGMLMSLRDLRGHHIEMLSQARDQISQYVQQHYNVDGCAFRMFFHYFPTYPHLHIHIVSCSINRPAGMTVGVAHLLDDVLDNLASCSDYYVGRTLSVYVPANHPIIN